MPSLRIFLATALLVALATVPVSADEASEPISSAPSARSPIASEPQPPETVQKTVPLSLDRLCESRSALIIAAVTGHIDVSAWSKQGTTDCRLDQIEEATSA